jgi:hypothetical protein
MRKALIELFHILNVVSDKRDPYDETALAAFPYVNGGLFAYEDIEIPNFTDEIRDLLLTQASENFDWSDISPTIFGAVFESTLNPETRRTGGMHYTSIENIHKVIDPLFLNDLYNEFREICTGKQINVRSNKLLEFQNKLSNLTFFDPALGSGNFLTESYICLRRLENKIIYELHKEQMIFGDDVIKISIGQFYGIEINDFAVTVAKTAMWIAESQMMKETEDIIHQHLEFLPLTTDAHIVEGNALRMDWESVLPKNKAKFIMGNPPFVGYAYQNVLQKEDMKLIFPKDKNLDYVAAWYKKSIEYMNGTVAHTAFVSTNSITQGEQVAVLWKPILESGAYINFAHRTFKWNSEAFDKAAVHCVIIGFSLINSINKVIYDNDKIIDVGNINPYLINAPNVYIFKRQKPLCDVPEIVRGSDPVDGGNLIIEADEYEDFIKKEPLASKYIRQYMMGNEFINNKKRYCLWLVDTHPDELMKMPLVLERIEKCRQMRLSSKRSNTLRAANSPFLFESNRQPNTDYIAIPKVSSERRRYIPIGYLSKDIIAGDKLFTIPNAGLYHFGILTSNVHNAWMRTVCGRLEMRYSYSNTIVYNNFPWPDVNKEQKSEIEKHAQAILDARAEYPNSTLANMYGETSILFHTKLLEAHRKLDKTVMQLYGLTTKNTESECVELLMEMYQDLI